MRIENMMCLFNKLGIRRDIVKFNTQKEEEYTYVSIIELPFKWVILGNWIGQPHDNKNTNTIEIHEFRNSSNCKSITVYVATISIFIYWIGYKVGKSFIHSLISLNVIYKSFSLRGKFTSNILVNNKFWKFFKQSPGDFNKFTH